ncbi:MULTISPECIES: hypothetical protein [Moraxella]|nr:hypothetical protein [Moraxella catarrhalis]STY82864.1 Uncharacterised protein [Moraxella catarrhalis]
MKALNWFYCVIAVSMIAISGCSKSDVESNVAQEEPKMIEQEPLPLPQTGVLSHPNGESVAPFKVVVDDNGHNYYIKLIDSISGDLVSTYFIRSGEFIDTTVPVGDYQLKYAAGKDWFGYDDYFGKETVYKKADTNFLFTQEPNGYSGHEIQLILQVDGNLTSSHISTSEF